MYEKMERVIYNETYSGREAYLFELMSEVPALILSRLHQELEDISNAIKEEFPNCLKDELEINQKQLAELYDDSDLDNSLYIMTQED